MFEGLLEYLKEKLPQKIIDGGYNSYEIYFLKLGEVFYEKEKEIIYNYWKCNIVFIISAWNIFYIL